MTHETFVVVWYGRMDGTEYRLARGPKGQLEISFRSLMHCGKAFGPGRPWVIASHGSAAREWVLVQAYNDLFAKLQGRDDAKIQRQPEV